MFEGILVIFHVFECLFDINLFPLGTAIEGKKKLR